MWETILSDDPCGCGDPNCTVRRGYLSIKKVIAGELLTDEEKRILLESFLSVVTLAKWLLHKERVSTELLTSVDELNFPLQMIKTC